LFPFIGILAFLFCGPLAMADKTPLTVDYEGRVQELEREIPSLYLLNGLCLSAKQYDQLAAILEKVAKSDEELGKRIEQLEQGDTKQEDRETAREAARLAKGEKTQPPPKKNMLLKLGAKDLGALRKERSEQMAKHVDEVRDLLTPAQMEIMDSFSPCFIPPSDFRNPVRVGQAKNDSAFGEKVLARLRKVPKDQLPQAKERALEFLAPYVMEKRHIKYSDKARDQVRAEITKNLDAALPKIRSLNDVDFELDKSNLAQQVAPIDETTAVNRPPRQETQQKIQAYVLNVGCLDVVRSRGTNPSPVAGPATGIDRATLRDQAGERQTIRLLEKLQLAPEQVEKLLPILREAAAATVDIEGKIATAQQEAIGPYEKLRAELAAQNPTPATEHVAQQYHGTIKGLREQDLVDLLLPFKEKADSVFSADQVVLLAKVGTPERPLANTSDSGIGETKARALRLLDRVRKMNEGEFENTRSGLAASFVGSCLDDETQKVVDPVAESARIVDVLTSVHAMDRETYARRKQDLASELCPKREAPRPVQYGDKYIQGEPLPVLDRGSMLLFRPGTVQLLEGMRKK